MSERPSGAYLDGLQRLPKAAVRERLVAVRSAVHARLDELRDPDLRAGLQSVSDAVDRLLMATSREAVETLARGLDASHGYAEPVAPLQPGRLPPRQRD